MNFLILAAFAPELEPLRGMAEREPLLRAGSAGTGIRFEEVGVGIASAAANTARLIAELRPAHVVFVGSIGTTDQNIPLLQLVSANSIEMVDAAIVEGSAYLPSLCPTEYLADEPMMHRLSESCPERLLMAKCYSPISITSKAELGLRYARATQAHFENLELFGIAAACAAHQTPWNSICAVTNYVGEQGHEQWKEHHEEAATYTARSLVACLEAIEARPETDTPLRANNQRP